MTCWEERTVLFKIHYIAHKWCKSTRWRHLAAIFLNYPIGYQINVDQMERVSRHSNQVGWLSLHDVTHRCVQKRVSQNDVIVFHRGFLFQLPRTNLFIGSNSPQKKLEHRRNTMTSYSRLKYDIKCRPILWTTYLRTCINEWRHLGHCRLDCR